MRRVADMTRKELEHEALTDPLTGVGNRRAFDEDEATWRAGYYAVIDIEGTKYVNDEFGHMTGDAMILATAHVLALHFGNRVYRTGGDEFVIRCSEVGTYEKLKIIVERFPLLSYGLATTLADADEELNYWRAYHEKTGKRAPRGQRPRQLARVFEREVG